MAQRLTRPVEASVPVAPHRISKNFYVIGPAQNSHDLRSALCVADTIGNFGLPRPPTRSALARCGPPERKSGLMCNLVEVDSSMSYTVRKSCTKVERRDDDLWLCQSEH